MYKIIALMSTLVRLFYLPNPFETLEYGYIINYIVEPMFHFLTFNVVGLYYRRGKAPAFGSFLYLMFYSIHTGLIMLMGVFNWNSVAIVVIFILYFSSHILVKVFLEGSYY